jgi:hypothetical protein
MKADQKDVALAKTRAALADFLNLMEEAIAIVAWSGPRDLANALDAAVKQAEEVLNEDQDHALVGV